jgi:hypothetical protein
VAGVPSIPNQGAQIRTKGIPARLRGLLEARALSTRTRRACRGDQTKSQEKSTHLQELNTGMKMRGGEETHVLPRSSPSTDSLPRAAIVCVNSRHSGMTANGGEATGRILTSSRESNAAAPESNWAHASSHAIRPTHHVL